MEKGFLELEIINKTEITFYLEVFFGMLLDDSSQAFCIHTFLEKPAERDGGIRELHPLKLIRASFSQRKRVFFLSNGVTINIQTVKDGDKMSIIINSVDAEEGTN